MSKIDDIENVAACVHRTMGYLCNSAELALGRDAKNHWLLLAAQEAVGERWDGENWSDVLGSTDDVDENRLQRLMLLAYLLEESL